MNTSDDLVLENLFVDAQDTDVGTSHDDFAAAVSSRILAYQARRELWLDALWLAVSASFVVLMLIALPTALPEIKKVVVDAWTKQASIYGITNQAALLIVAAVTGAISWAVAVKN